MSSSEYEVEETGDDGLGFGNILAGVAIGVLVGGGLALLFAPKPGVELRSELGDAVDDVRARARADDRRSSKHDARSGDPVTHGAGTKRARISFDRSMRGEKRTRRKRTS